MALCLGGGREKEKVGKNGKLKKKAVYVEENLPGRNESR